MKKNISALLAAVLLLSAVLTGILSGCGAGSSSETEGPSLYQQGKEAIVLLREMVQSDDYLSMTAANKAVKEQLKTNASGDYQAVTGCYEIILTEEKVLALTEDSKFSELPDSLQKYFLKDRLVGSLASRINAQAGAEAAAAAAVCTAGRLFVKDDLKNPALYLYTFQDTAPVLVSFIPGDGGAVSAVATLVLSPEFQSVASAEDAQAALEKVLPGCTVQSVPLS